MISMVAVDDNWGIGLNGDLPWHIPGEQVFFREKTIGNTIVMGRKTLESLTGGKPLKGRRNIILTRNPDFSCDGAKVVFNPEELLNAIHGLDSDKVFLIGGAQVYRLLLPYCKKAYVTKVDGCFKVDSHHPNLDCDSDWRVADISEEIVSTGISYKRYFYENIFLVGNS